MKLRERTQRMSPMYLASSFVMMFTPLSKLMVALLHYYITSIKISTFTHLIYIKQKDKGGCHQHPPVRQRNGKPFLTELFCSCSFDRT
jgi:hypothetical protein